MCESLQSCLLISDGVEDESMITKGQRSLILVFNQSRDPSCRPPVLLERSRRQRKWRNKGSFRGVGAINSQKSDRGCWRNSCTLKKKTGVDIMWQRGQKTVSQQVKIYFFKLSMWIKSLRKVWKLLFVRRASKMPSLSKIVLALKNTSSWIDVQTLQKLLTLTPLTHHQCVQQCWACYF